MLRSTLTTFNAKCAFSATTLSFDLLSIINLHYSHMRPRKYVRHFSDKQQICQGVFEFWSVFLEFSIRMLENSDWEAASEIYRQGLETGQAAFETEPPTFSDWDNGHLPFGRIAAVSLPDESLIGWAALSAVSKCEAYNGVAEVSVYVSEKSRGKGVGHALLQALIEEA